MREPKGRRCFLALPLDDAAREDFREVLRGIEIEALRKTPAENLHVTLKFLGDVPDTDLKAVIDAARGALGEHRSFEMALAGIEYMPNPRRARVLAAVFETTDEGRRLFESVELAMSELGFPLEGRAYRPHATLGRFRTPPHRLPRPESFSFPATTVPVESVVLMESTLGGSAPIYTPLAEFPLTRPG